ncbi:MAG: ribonuclease III [Candidatus Hydrogenedentes bacterium]|nr:ribonuclease III [Candidatus Hydrogenedentota bacterium]
MTVSAEREIELRSLTTRLELGLESIELLDRALTHASIQSEQSGPSYDYESLEFLGDAALSLAVAHYLFAHAPDRSPGEYSRMRASLVNQQCLAQVAERLQIAPVIRLGKGEEMSGGRNRSALLADCLEALIGTVYVERGWDATHRLVVSVFRAELEHATRTDTGWDHKSRLQHYCQAEKIPLPRFELVRSDGPDHQKLFEVEVILRGVAAGRGSGLNKKEAEQNAARAALTREGVIRS